MTHRSLFYYIIYALSFILSGPSADHPKQLNGSRSGDIHVVRWHPISFQLGIVDAIIHGFVFATRTPGQSLLQAISPEIHWEHCAAEVALD